MKKAFILALAAASVMMFALPAVSSAKSWVMDWDNHAQPLTFTVGTVTAPKLKTHTGDVVECTTVTGTGAYTTTTTGNLQLTFHGCKDEGTGVTCTTTGQPAGTIQTTNLTFHNVYSNHGGKEGPAVLITPNAGHFASFGCTVFGFGVHVKVGGTGIIGTVEQCGTGNAAAPNRAFGLLFTAAAPGTQTHTTTVNTGSYDLNSSRNGAAPVTASQEGTGNVLIPEVRKPNATC
jgi:hypothetical protein